MAPTWMAGAQTLEPSSAALPRTLAGARSEVEQPGFNWHAQMACSLIHYATTPAPFICLFILMILFSDTFLRYTSPVVKPPMTAIQMRINSQAKEK